MKEGLLSDIVSKPTSDAYRTNYERIFGKPKTAAQVLEDAAQFMREDDAAEEIAKRRATHGKKIEVLSGEAFEAEALNFSGGASALARALERQGWHRAGDSDDLVRVVRGR